MSRIGVQASRLSGRDFPSFSQLPHENDLGYRRRHWCLLGEITDVIMWDQPRMTLRDLEGSVFPLHAHITDFSATLRLRDMVPGHTLAVMCAERHDFMDHTVGIRLEKKGTAYIFRANLDALVVEIERVAARSRCFQCGGKAEMICPIYRRVRFGALKGCSRVALRSNGRASQPRSRELLGVTQILCY